MKQEYTDKMKFYQGEEYEKFLKEKHVLDARQFLHSSLLYLNYALITAKLYEDIGKKNIDESNQNPFYNKVEVLGWNYNAHTLLNKLTLEWVSHISNSLDCLLQYINSALNLGLARKAVKEGIIAQKLTNYPSINNFVREMWDDEIINYIRSVYNYSKHTLDLYGGSSFLDVIAGQKDVYIPNFKYRNNIYESKTTSELISYYEIFIGKYIDILESINAILQISLPIENRYHVGRMIVDGHAMGACESDHDIILFAEFDTDGVHIKRYWIENINFDSNEAIEIMLPHSKTRGQHFDGIATIEITFQGNKVGELRTDINKIENSVLCYHKYIYVAI